MIVSRSLPTDRRDRKWLALKVRREPQRDDGRSCLVPSRCNTGFPREAASRYLVGFSRYRPRLLLGMVADRLGPAARLRLHGYGDFHEDHENLQARMQSLGIPHDYRDGPPRAHLWGSGWLAKAVDFLANGLP